MKRGFLIDQEGFYIEDVVVEEDQELPEEAILIPVSQDAGFHRPHWNQDLGAWEEGEVPAVIIERDTETATIQDALTEDLAWVQAMIHGQASFTTLEEANVAFTRLARLMLAYAAPYLQGGEPAPTPTPSPSPGRSPSV